MWTMLSRAGERGFTKVIALPVVLLIVPMSYAGHQAPSGRHDPGSESYRISVDVALVVLPATVTDRRGGFVSNLVEGDFRVYENGVLQRIQLFKDEDIPVTVGLVVDHSSSMLHKVAEAAAAAKTFVQSSNRDDEMFVVNFNEKVSLGLPPATRFTHNTVELANAMITSPAGGQTALYDAIAKGLDELQAGIRNKKVLIVVSDGGDNASVLKLSQAMKRAEQSNAVIYTIGVFDEDDPDQNPGVLKRFAQSTGGQAFLPKQISEVASICQHIARDIRHQYTIGYVPMNRASDGAYRAIRVHAQAKGHGELSVRTRTGYRSSAGPQLSRIVVK